MHRFLSVLVLAGTVQAAGALVPTPTPTPSPVPTVSSVPTVLPSPVPTDPTIWLGLTPEASYRDRGAPAEIYPLAVDEKRWQAVHFYPDHTYLFWSSNRVWEVRLDKLWAGSYRGITMGMARDGVEALLGTPAARGDSWSVWALPYQTFPRKLRIVFTDGLVSDLYVYRSDL